MCFHWLGDLYGRIFLELLQYNFPVRQGTEPGLYMWSGEEPHVLPTWTEAQVTRHLRDHFHRYESLLSLGAYHRLLPMELRRRTVIEQFDVLRFVRVTSQLRVVKGSEDLTDSLIRLVAE